MQPRSRRGGMPDRFAFIPNAGRSRLVAADVREGLADSLLAALRALDQHAPARAADLIARIRAAPVAPAVFGAYTELVEAIFADDTATARRIADDLTSPDFGRVAGLRVVTLGDDDLGPGGAARYRRLLDEDPEVGTSLRALTPAEFGPGSERVHEALALLDAGAPELSGELRALLHEIVLVETAGGGNFGGASSFQLWGALFLRLEPGASRYEIAESLAHEAAHALLFGFGLGKPLVENPDEVRFASPLRFDVRPMDGVVHATYVVARMHYTAARLLASGALTRSEEGPVRAALTLHARHFADGAAVIDSHARWTPAGEAAFAGARAYIASAAH